MPICGRENLRILFCIIASLGWDINNLDIKAVFLQGKPIERNVYLKPPKEAQTEKIWRLNTKVYGLCDAPRAWYLSVKQELIKTGGTKSKHSAIFYWHNGNKLERILSSHVHGFLWAGTSWFYAHVIDHLRKKFVMSQEEIETSKYLGLQIQQSKNGIEIHQTDYIEEVEAIKLDNPSQKDRVLLPHETQQLRRVAGQLNWVST